MTIWGGCSLNYGLRGRRKKYEKEAKKGGREGRRRRRRVWGGNGSGQTPLMRKHHRALPQPKYCQRESAWSRKKGGNRGSADHSKGEAGRDVKTGKTEEALHR